MRGITPCLWFEKDTEEAVNFWVSLFDDAEITQTLRYPDEQMHEAWRPGEVLTIEFRLQGQDFIALNGGPQPGFTFTSAVSFSVECDTQEEIDRLWDALTEGGQEQACGWLVDRFGVTWQIVPRVLNEMVRDPDEGRRNRAMKAMLPMVKLDIAALQAAVDGDHVGEAS